MTIQNFILKIEGLKTQLINLDHEIGSEWNIQIIDNEFNAYSSPLFHLVFCLDTLRLFHIFQPNFQDIKEDDDFYFWGEDTTTNWIYALDQESNEILLLDLTSMSTMEHCAKDDYHFLDLLEIAAQYYYQKIVTIGVVEANQTDWLTKCCDAAGGKKYENFCKRLLG